MEFKSFFEWMELQADRDDAVGNLAADMVLDTEKNGLNIQTATEWRGRVESQARSPLAKRMVIEVWELARVEYRQARREWGKRQKDRDPYNHDFWG